MKKLFYVMLALAALGLSAASCNKVNVGGNGSHYVFTDESENVTAGTAKVNGHYNAPTITGENVGFIYDRQDSFKEKSSPRETTVPTSEGKFWLTFKDLDPDTIYSYMAYANIDGKEERGKVKSFRTEKAVFTDDPQDVSAGSARLSGHFGDGLQVQKAGFIYDLSSSFKIESSSRYEATISGKQFSFNLLALPAATKFTYVAYIKLKNGKEFYGSPVSFSTTATPVSSVSVTPPTAIVYLEDGSTKQLTATVYPPDAGDKSLTWKSSDAQIADVNSTGLVTCKKGGKVTITATSNQNPSKSGSCALTVKDVPPQYAVDMGLPSGIYWRDRNLGASSVTDKGNHYAWAETGQKTNFLETNYKFYDASKLLYTRYYGSGAGSYVTDHWDTLGQNDYKDDAARSSLGGSWRIPSDSNISELFNNANCTITKTTKSGVDGILIKAKNPDRKGNKNELFFPFGGYYDGTAEKFYYESSYGKEQGYYWMDLVRGYNSGGSWNNKTAYVFAPYHDNGYISRWGSQFSRYYGMMIRPVCD